MTGATCPCGGDAEKCPGMCREVLVPVPVNLPKAEWFTNPDERILWGVVANAGRLSDRPLTRWAHVVAATGLGSTSSAALCRRFDFDPDELIGGGKG